MLVLLGANLAEHDRVDDFEMRRVGGQRQMDLVAVEFAIRGGAEVIFHVARAFDVVVGRNEPPWNSWNRARCGLPITWQQHVEAAAVRPCRTRFPSRRARRRA